MRGQVAHIILFFFLLGFSSCTTYYYSLIDTNEWRVTKMDNGDFIQDNDTVSIIYCFYGENLPIEITIKNKLDQPLFLDWQQSALVIDDATTSYYNRNITVRGEIHSNTYTYRDFLFQNSNYSELFGSFAAQATMPEGVAFIPPQATINTTPVTLTDFYFERIPNEAFQKAKYPVRDGSTKSVKMVNFTEEESPLRFKSYLTLYTITPNGVRDKQIVSEQSFYISRLMNAGSMTPINIPANQEQRGDFFYVRKDNNSYLGIMAAGIVAIGVAGVAIDATVKPRH